MEVGPQHLDLVRTRAPRRLGAEGRRTSRPRCRRVPTDRQAKRELLKVLPQGDRRTSAALAFGRSSENVRTGTAFAPQYEPVPFAKQKYAGWRS